MSVLWLFKKNYILLILEEQHKMPFWPGSVREMCKFFHSHKYKKWEVEWFLFLRTSANKTNLHYRKKRFCHLVVLEKAQNKCSGQGDKTGTILNIVAVPNMTFFKHPVHCLSTVDLWFSHNLYDKWIELLTKFHRKHPFLSSLLHSLLRKQSTLHLEGMWTCSVFWCLQHLLSFISKEMSTGTSYFKLKSIPYTMNFIKYPLSPYFLFIRMYEHVQIDVRHCWALNCSYKSHGKVCNAELIGLFSSYSSENQTAPSPALST